MNRTTRATQPRSQSHSAAEPRANQRRSQSHCKSQGARVTKPRSHGGRATEPESQGARQPRSQMSHRGYLAGGHAPERFYFRGRETQTAETR